MNPEEQIFVRQKNFIKFFIVVIPVYSCSEIVCLHFNCHYYQTRSRRDEFLTRYKQIPMTPVLGVVW
jgi:hypothetical protein